MHTEYLIVILRGDNKMLLKRALQVDIHIVITARTEYTDKTLHCRLQCPPIVWFGTIKKITSFLF